MKNQKPNGGLGLQNIANQCPLAGGRAVYQARGLWLALQPEARWDDDSLCNAVGMSYRQQADPAADGSPLIEMLPNPASDRVRLCSRNGVGYSGEVELCDMFGRTIMSYRVGETTRATEFTVAGLVPGIYTCRLKSTAGALLFSGKLFINR